MQNQHSSNWTVAKVFKDPQGFAVEVSTSPGKFNEPQYSFRVGQMVSRQDKTEHFSVHMRASKDRSSMVHVNLRQPFAEALTRLLNEAQEWIVTEMAIRHDSDIEARIEKEQRSANFGQQKTRHTGKTEKNRNKRRAA